MKQVTFHRHHKVEIKYYESETCLWDCDWRQPADLQVFCGCDAQRTSRKSQSVDSLSTGSRPAEQLPAFPRNVWQWLSAASAGWQDNCRAWPSIPWNVQWLTINRVARCPFRFPVKFSKKVKVTWCTWRSLHVHPALQWSFSWDRGSADFWVSQFWEVTFAQ